QRKTRAPPIKTGLQGSPANSRGHREETYGPDDHILANSAAARASQSSERLLYCSVSSSGWICCVSRKKARRGQESPAGATPWPEVGRGIPVTIDNLVSRQ